MLMREVPAPLITRMWDTYLAEVGDGFCDYHVFVCSAFLVRWRTELLAMDFQVMSQRFQDNQRVSNMISISGNYDVCAKSPNERLDGEGHRAFVESGVCMEVSFSQYKTLDNNCLTR